MAKRLRDAEENLKGTTGYKLKIVERGGTKLEDLLHRSDPCQGQDCCRQGCLLCATKQYTGKNSTQDCSKRSLVYKTYCISCQEKDEAEIRKEEKDEKRAAEKIRNIKQHAYIGETSRSAFERATEHQNAMRQLDPSSHMLRHALDKHEGEKIKEIRFGMIVLQFTRTSFERQILESVTIQQNRHHNILNSRMEYNRCSIPRLSTRLGDREYKQYEKELKAEKEKEEALEERIRAMRKNRNKQRRGRPQKSAPAAKRRKTGKNSFSQNCQVWEVENSENIETDTARTEKRQDEKEELDCPAPKRMKTKQIDMRKYLTTPPIELLNNLPLPVEDTEVQQLLSQTVLAEPLPKQDVQMRQQLPSPTSQAEQRRQHGDASDQAEQPDGRGQAEQPGPDNTHKVRQPLTIQRAVAR